MSHIHDMTVEWAGTTNPRWYHYFLSGWVGTQNYLKSEGKKDFSGLDVLIYGEVPPGAGLSSSSALVSASVLTSMIAYNGNVFGSYTTQQIAEIAINSERYVGTEGGGMDQAVACLANKGSALRVDFEPLKSHTVKLPQPAVFAVLHSGITANKAANNLYNQRVVECRIAAQILYRKLVDSKSQSWTKIRRLKDLQLALNESLEECGKKVDSLLSNRPYSRAEVLKELDASDEELKLHSLNVNTQEMENFKIHNRAKHVFEEAARVQEFESHCKELSGNELEKERSSIILMGEIMNKSHTSCKELYECSCPELDELVEKCRKAGCVGARLTGAGWGGCVVAICLDKDKEKVEQQLDILFWTEPSAGIEAMTL